jgi:phospholipid/cholesterol/gamma-HCH transport system permease protein
MADATPAALDSFVRSVGRQAMTSLSGAAATLRLLVRVVYYVLRGRRERGAMVRQMYEIGSRSVFLLTVVMGFIGMILVLQAGLQTQRLVPDLTMLGASYLELLVRDLGASITALMLATRVGAGIAAQIGAMVVTEQVDALRMCAADPIDYLVKPRFLASIIMTVVLTIWSMGVAMTTGFLTAKMVFEIGPTTFYNFQLVRWSDVGLGLTKALAYGTAIPLVSSHSGLSTFGGSEGVGWATTRAVVNSSLTVIALDLLLSTFGFLLFS